MGAIKGLLLGFISIITFTSFSAAYASSAGELSYEEELAEYYLIDAVDTINRMQLREDTAYAINGISVADKCTSFLNKEQVLGANGKKINDSFVQLAPSIPNLVQGGSLNKYCPKYKDMKLEEKSLVWVLILTMVAHFESSCNPTIEAKGPNGTATGYYQLHQNKEARYDGSLNVCKKGSSAAADSVHACTLGMLQHQFQTQNDILFSTKSYWDVLRPNGASQKEKHIRTAIQKMKLCNPPVT